MDGRSVGNNRAKKPKTNNIIQEKADSESYFQVNSSLKVVSKERPLTEVRLLCDQEAKEEI